MAGDWIKMRSDLQRHPKVVRISSALRADRLRVIGGLHAVWSLFDEHSEDGHIDGYSAEVIDDLIGWPGFCHAMSSVEWLHVSDDYCALPRFDEHNGKSAKRRAMETQRKRSERAQGVQDVSASDADKKRSREEKRRINTPLPPGGGDAEPKGFAEFWQTWPKSDRKQAKGKCLEAWKKAGAERFAADIVAHVSSLANSEKWREAGGQFIPAPLTYIGQRRWEGAAESAGETTSVGAFV